MNGTLTDVPGLKVGHWTDLAGGTGCTVVLCPEGAVAGVDVRGSAPGTRETALLNPVNLVQTVHAVVLAGGSAFGLAAADGAMRWLEAQGRGIDVGMFSERAVRVPIVPAAVIFDLPLGSPWVRPDAAAGYAACEAASAEPVAQGTLGAGTGATVGKATGLTNATKGGLGSASRQVGGLVVAALAVVNPWGEVVDPRSGQVLAGARRPEGGFQDTIQLMQAYYQLGAGAAGSPQNTTLAVVGTNAGLTKAGATKVAQMAHDGLARTIRPIHTMFDGDTIFTLALGPQPGDINLVGALAAEVVAEAVVNGVRAATGLAGVPALRDLPASG